MTFEDAVEIVLKHEGGYSNDARDPGGETNFGISKRSYPSVDIASLGRPDAIAIYKRDYWNAIGIERLPGILRLIVFDAAVNQGPRAAITMLQCVLDVKQDGIIGPQTLVAIKYLGPDETLDRYAALRLNTYFRNKRFTVFGEGWVRRLLSVSIATRAEDKNVA